MRVFIIDDEQVSLFLTKRLLILKGVSEEKEVFTFLSAGEALDALSEAKEDEIPGALLLDLNMPLVNGWKFIEALGPVKSKISGRCKIFILTSSLGLNDFQQAGENHMVADFFRKPISEEHIKVLKSLEDTIKE